MNKIKDWFKKNKKKTIMLGLALISLILCIIFLVAVIKYLMPNTKKSVYGDRCAITADHPIADDREDTIKKFLDSKDYSTMKFVSFERKCNLIDVIVEVEDKTSFSKVKAMGKKLLSVFDKDEQKYYDIQLIIRSDNDESEDYPKIGTHHKEINGSINDDFIW